MVVSNVANLRKTTSNHNIVAVAGRYLKVANLRKTTSNHNYDDGDHTGSRLLI